METPITADGGVRKRIVKEAPPEAKRPTTGDEVQMHYVGRVKGAEDAFDDSRRRGAPFKFVLGEGQTIRAWELAVPTMQVGERAEVECVALYAYGSEGHPPAIPPGATLVFDMELLEFGKKQKELYEMSREEKASEATKAKEQGVVLVRRGEWGPAYDSFLEAARLCDLPGFTRNREDYGEMPEALRLVYGSSQLNAAQCALKLKAWADAASCATRAIKFEGPTAKALFRRGVARSHLGLVEDAKSDLLAAAKLAPKDRAIRGEYERVKTLAASQGKAQKGVFASAFDKVDLFADKPTNVHAPSLENNPFAFLDVKTTTKDGTDCPDLSGRLVLCVFADACPKTSRNFLALCRGSSASKHTNRRLHYKGTPVHRIMDDFGIQAGDVVCNNGTSGESIYGRVFDDEHFRVKHDHPGTLSMANRGPNTNNSQFFITLNASSHCDGKFVAFGRLVVGLDLLKGLVNLAVDDAQAPADHVIMIADSGSLSRDDAQAAIAEATPLVPEVDEPPAPAPADA